MDADEVVLWVCLGASVLLGMLFLVFTVTTGGVKAFALYILFPIFIICFLVGMVLLVQLIIKLNDKLDGNTNGLNKKIDTNNFLIKDSVDNIDNYLQNVDYTVIVEDRNVPITVDEVDALGAPFRYQPKIYQPSLEIPNVKEVEINEDLDNLKSTQILSGKNVKSIVVENDEPIMIQNLPIKQELLVENTIIVTEETINEDSLSINELYESLSVDESIDEDVESLYESHSVNESIIEDSMMTQDLPIEQLFIENKIVVTEVSLEDSLSINELYESLSIDESIKEDVDSLYESLSVNETVIEDLELDFEIFSTIEDDNLSISSNFCIENLFEIKPLHEEFLFVYDLFEEK
jgi:hypothetical protein